MSRSARWAMAAWFLLAIVVFNVRFDWQARMAGYEFVREQVARHRQGLPVQTINERFRPMVRQAAIDASPALLIGLVGVVLSYGAEQLTKRNA